jgi:hypothetical protein
MKKLLVIVLVLALAMSATPITTSAASFPLPANMIAPLVTSVDALQTVASTHDYDYPWIGWSQIPSLQTVINADGSVSVMDTGNLQAQYLGDAAVNKPQDKVIIYEFAADGKLNHTQSLTKVLPLTGGFTKDKDGNYYVFYAKEVAEGAFAEKNMVLVKYSPQGEKLLEYWEEANPGGHFHGVKVPFAAGTCRLEISGDMLSAYFPRDMFVADDGLNHQGSHGFVVNINTLQPVSDPLAVMKKNGTLSVPVIGHSFNQFILPIDNGFIYVDQGDGWPRAFNFTKVTKGVLPNPTGESFSFEGAIGDNNTDAELGGLVQTSSGYLFFGTYNKIKPTPASRDIFLLKLDKDLQGGANPIWKTSYTTPNATPTPSFKVVSPKIVQIAADRYVIMWASYFSTDPMAKPDKYTSYLQIIDGKGNTIEQTRKVVDENRRAIPLNAFDVLRYNPKTGMIYWAVNDNGSIKLYSVDPLAGLD